MTQHNMPTLWGFLHFNYTESDESDTLEKSEKSEKPEKPEGVEPADAAVAETVAETVAERPSKSPALTPAEWQYPDDCFYIKMYILAPLAKMVEAFGPKHRYGDEKRRAGDGVRGKARSAASGRSRSRARRRTRRSISSKCVGMGEIDARGCTISDTSS